MTTPSQSAPLSKPENPVMKTTHNSLQKSAPQEVSPAPQQWAKDAAEDLFTMLGYGSRSSINVQAVAAIITKHAAAISEENERLKRERDEAIKAHGFVWNAARKAAQYFRWAGCRDTIAIEAMNQCCEAERLTPKWSTDWVIVTPLELTALRQWSEQTREAIRAHIADLGRMAVVFDSHGMSKTASETRLAATELAALLQSHPAATNLTEEGKK